jgi:hypothetical protein
MTRGISRLRERQCASGVFRQRSFGVIDQAFDLEDFSVEGFSQRHFDQLGCRRSRVAPYSRSPTAATTELNALARTRGLSGSSPGWRPRELHFQKPVANRWHYRHRFREKIERYLSYLRSAIEDAENCPAHAELDRRALVAGLQLDPLPRAARHFKRKPGRFWGPGFPMVVRRCLSGGPD